MIYTTPWEYGRVNAAKPNRDRMVLDMARAGPLTAPSQVPDKAGLSLGHLDLEWTLLSS